MTQHAIYTSAQFQFPGGYGLLDLTTPDSPNAPVWSNSSRTWRAWRVAYVTANGEIRSEREVSEECDERALIHEARMVLHGSGIPSSEIDRYIEEVRTWIRRIRADYRARRDAKTA